MTDWPKFSHALDQRSPVERLANAPQEVREAFMATLKPADANAMLYEWRGFHARPAQVAPDGDWTTWLALAGRGWGKTEAGAQWIRERVNAGARSIALVAETQKDLEEVMVSRILAIYPPGEAPSVRYKPVRLQWANGATALGYNGTEPNQLRGPEFDTAWVDELAKYRYARETWDMLQFALRSGEHPRQLVTTTPRPIELIKELVARAAMNDGVVITRGSTLDNRSNLAPSFLREVQARYDGTRLGRQELGGEVLGDMPGALWTRDVLDRSRLLKPPQLARIVVAVDPAVTAGEEADETGIVICGMGQDGRGYVLDDRSLRASPQQWARAAVTAYRYYEADAIVAEVNNGGDMVAMTLRSVDPNVHVQEVRASRGKHIRAEPISALYEQGRVSHVGGWPELEDQMCLMTQAGYVGEKSPDRLDALVWGMTALFDPIMWRAEEPDEHYEEPQARSLTGY